MSFDLDKKEGMENAIAWLQNTIDLLREGGMWGIPRSGAIYCFNKRTKTFTSVNSDGPTDRVLAAMGWVRE